MPERKQCGIGKDREDVLGKAGKGRASGRKREKKREKGRESKGASGGERKRWSHEGEEEEDKT